jgi:hypothetical protein
MEINGESCKAIPGYSRYVISEYGRIYRIVALTKNEKNSVDVSKGDFFFKESKVQFFDKKNHGRWSQVGLTNNNGKFCTAAAEKLVCETYNLWNKKRIKYSVELKDGNPRNFHISNLITSPLTPNNAKLTKEDVKNIKKMIAAGRVLKHIASEYNVSDMQISRIKTGENWRKGGRVIQAPKTPFKVKDGRMRRLLSSFEHTEIDDNIRRPFSIKRTDNPNINKIIGVVNGFRFSKSHSNISRARIIVFKLNSYFFNEGIAQKTDDKIKAKIARQSKEIHNTIHTSKI